MSTTFYKAPHPVQVAGTYYPAGEVFAFTPAELGKDGEKTIMSQPGSEWEKVNVTEASSTVASHNSIPDDADLEALPLTALKAVAFLRHVPSIDKLDAEGLKTAIRGSYEPKL